MGEIGQAAFVLQDRKARCPPEAPGHSAARAAGAREGGRCTRVACTRGCRVPDRLQVQQVVLAAGESSLYALTRAWVRNGPPDPSPPAAPAASLDLPEGPPASEAECSQQWPAACFAAHHDHAGVTPAATYKLAWAACHKHFVSKRRRKMERYGKRHQALLALSQ